MIIFFNLSQIPTPKSIVGRIKSYAPRRVLQRLLFWVCLTIYELQMSLWKCKQFQKSSWILPISHRFVTNASSRFIAGNRWMAINAVCQQCRKVARQHVRGVTNCLIFQRAIMTAVLISSPSLLYLCQPEEESIESTMTISVGHHVPQPGLEPWHNSQVCIRWSVTCRRRFLPHECKQQQ